MTGNSLGELTFVAPHWFWHAEGAQPVLIDVDPDQRLKFMDEAVDIAKMSEPMSIVAAAELRGRMDYFRDETLDMAVMFARSRIRRDM